MSISVSVIMALYNNAGYLAEAVDSVRRQTFGDWELIIMDDGSDDGSMELAEKMAQEDPRIRVLRMARNSGAGAARDQAIRHARGKYIAVFDADDVCEPGRLEEQVAFLERNPGIVAVGTQAVLIDEQGREVGTKTFPTEPAALYRMMYTSIPIQLPTLMVNTDLLPPDFDWFEGWPYSEDTLLFFKLARHGRIANLSGFLLQYRFHTNSVSYRNPKASFYKTRYARRLACREYGYTPTLRGRLVDGLQSIVIFMLPGRCVPWVYRNIRRLMLLLSGHAGSSSTR